MRGNHEIPSVLLFVISNIYPVTPFVLVARYPSSVLQAGVIISIAALTAYFWQMRMDGICAADLLGAVDDGYFDTGASDFTVRSGVGLPWEQL